MHTSTDESRGRALDEAYRRVEEGREVTQRDAERKFEQSVYEHFRGSI